MRTIDKECPATGVKYETTPKAAIINENEYILYHRENGAVCVCSKHKRTVAPCELTGILDGHYPCGSAFGLEGCNQHKYSGYHFQDVQSGVVDEDMEYNANHLDD